MIFVFMVFCAFQQTLQLPFAAITADTGTVPPILSLEIRRDGLEGAAPTDTSISALSHRLRQIQSNRLHTLPRTTAGAASTTATAYGTQWGVIGIGIGFQRRARNVNSSDGAAGMLVGLGDPSTVGVDAGMTVLDLRRSRTGTGGFGRRGSFNLKVHHAFQNGAAVAMGVDNVLVWGGSDTPASTYVVTSTSVKLRDSRFAVFNRLYVSAGLANGRYSSRADLEVRRSRVNAFGNLAVQVRPQLNLFGEWAGQDLNVGASFVPLEFLPVAMSVALADLTHSAGDGTRLIIGAGFAITFNKR
jgi:hypothetical protein